MKSIHFNRVVKKRTLPSSAFFCRFSIVFPFVILIFVSLFSCTTAPPDKETHPQPVKKEKQERVDKRAEEPELLREEKKEEIKIDEPPKASLPEDLQGALHSAVLEEDYEEAERLLDAGADIDGLSPEGWTVLMRVLDDPELYLLVAQKVNPEFSES